MHSNTMTHANSQALRHPIGRTQPRGYTMIDMLVSMSIIMLLIATLLPALSQARQASKRALCMTHQYDLGKFIERSTQEHNGYFPTFQYSFTYDAQSLIVSTITRDFREAGMDYFADAQFICPSDEQPGNISFLNAQNQVEVQAMSYGMNIDLLVQNVRIYDLKDASRTITMYDGSMSGPADGGKNIEGSYTGSFDMIDYARINRHYKETNVLYADGHVERKLRMDPVNLAAVGESTFVAASYAANTAGNNGGGNGSSLDDDDHDNNGSSSHDDDDGYDNNGSSSSDDDDDHDNNGSNSSDDDDDHDNNGSSNSDGDDDSNGNNGHGNNEDGVDSSNPGNGNGGPNGGEDPSGDVDDESNSSCNNGNNDDDSE